MSFARTLAAPTEVTIQRGSREFVYQIQPIDTLALLRHGKGEVLRAAIEDLRTKRVEGGAVPDDEEQLKLLGAKVAQVGLDNIVAGWELMCAVVRAGVVGGYDTPSERFDPIIIVERAADEDLSATPARVHQTRVAPDIRQLHEAIMALSAGKEDGEAVRTLFRQPIGGGEAAHVGDGVPHDALPGGKVDAG